MAPLSLRAYARRRGVSAEAVSKAVSAGRLDKSVTRVNGAPKIADPDLADREWREHTAERPPPTSHTPPPTRALAEPPDPSVPDFHAARARREEASARRESARAAMAEMDLATRRGQLIDVDQARRDVIGRFAIVRTRILGVPTRFAQRRPDLATEVVPILDGLLREALDELTRTAGDSNGR